MLQGTEEEGEEAVSEENRGSSGREKGLLGVPHQCE